MLPREKFINCGIDSLEDFELLCIILRTGTKGKDVFTLSKEIMNKYGDFVSLLNADYEELVKIKGLGKVKAIDLMVAFEMGKRYHFQKQNQIIKKINNPQSVYKISEDMIYFNEEVVKLISLDSKLNLLSYDMISKGTANSSIAHPRDIFKKAIKRNAVSMILVHNHPSGDPTPSEQDKILTEKLKECGKIIGIKLNDHIIVGKNSYYSFSLNRKVNINDR